MGQNKWYERSYRRNLVDMHIEDWDERFMSRFDASRYVDLLKKAHIQSAMVYANSHVGYCYWPTKIGHQHRGLKGRDILGEVIEGCHNADMDVIAYYSVIFNNWAYETHPEWRMVDIEGKASRQKPEPYSVDATRYGTCCPNNSEYRAFEEAQIKEICDGYSFEGIFFDMNFWRFYCYCPACRDRFAEEIGGDIPTVVDWQDNRWCQFQEKREQWLAEHAVFVSQIAKKYKPGVSVEHNSAGYMTPAKKGLTLRLCEANDYLGGDLYGGFLEQSFICKAYYCATPNMPFEYMTSRCYPSAHDHTTTKSKDTLALRALLALAHNGAFLFIDAVNPDGTQDASVYTLMGEIFAESAPYEKYLGGDLCMDVGVYFSLNAKMDPAENGTKVGNLVETNIRSNPHSDAALGAARILKENHVPFGVISKNRLEQLSDHRVVVLPDVLALDQEEQAAFQKYVQNGGRLYASGRSGGFLSDLCGVYHEGELKEVVSYFAATESAGNLLRAINPESLPCINGRQIKARAANDSEVKAKVVLPYTDPSNPTKFSSIHTNPPGVCTDLPAVIDRSVGKGRVVWISTPIEKLETDVHKSLFSGMIRDMADGKLTFKAEAPPAVEVIAFHQPDRKRFLLCIVNEQELLPPVPAAEIKVTLRMTGKTATKALLLPQESAVPFGVADDGVTIEVPTVELMCMIAVDYQ